MCGLVVCCVISPPSVPECPSSLDYRHHELGVLKSPLVIGERRCPIGLPLPGTRCLGCPCQTFGSQEVFGHSQQPQLTSAARGVESARFLMSFRSLLPSTVTANGFFRPHSAEGQGLFPKRLKTSRVRSLSYLPGTLPLPWVGLRRNLPTIQEEGPDDSRKELVSKTPAADLPPGLTAEQEK